VKALQLGQNDVRRRRHRLRSGASRGRQSSHSRRETLDLALQTGLGRRDSGSVGRANPVHMRNERTELLLSHRGSKLLDPLHPGSHCRARGVQGGEARVKSAKEAWERSVEKSGDGAQLVAHPSNVALKNAELPGSLSKDSVKRRDCQLQRRSHSPLHGVAWRRCDERPCTPLCTPLRWDVLNEGHGAPREHNGLAKR
jgi:hypothetical protein